MKKLFFNKVALGMLAAVTFFSSCKKDEGDDTNPASENPTIGFLDNTGTDKTVEIGKTFSFKVNAASNATTKKNLKELVIKHGSNTQPDTTVSLSGENYTGEFTFGAAESANTGETWTITVTDKAGKSASASFKVTTQGKPSDINTYSGKILGGVENNDNGSFFDAHKGEVHKQKMADDTPAMIDIVYFYGATNMAALGAPDDEEGVQVIAKNVKNWTTKNATRFQMLTTTAAEFDKINYQADLDALSLNPNEKRVAQLEAGKVFGFKTHDGKIGVAKVISVQPNANGSITLDFKIQK